MILIICTVALLASALTFFSGFGLGTLLLPAFALFFPVEQAVALTGVVHFLNSAFKFLLVGRHAERSVVVRFGMPAIAASIVGAGLLVWLAVGEPLYEYTAFGRHIAVTPVEAVVGSLLLAFAALEFLPRFLGLSFDARYMPLGGVLSGLFGGLSGMQGALRSAFLARAGLTRESFIGSGVAVACMIDLARLGVYLPAFAAQAGDLDYGLLAAATASALAGAMLGNRLLDRVTMPGIQRLVAAMLALVAAGLIAGIL